MLRSVSRSPVFASCDCTALLTSNGRDEHTMSEQTNETPEPLRADTNVQPQKTDAAPGANATLSESIKMIGGLLAVIAGVVVIAVIAAAAISKNSQTAATIAGSTSGAVATMVGAYFGVKLGTDQTKQALNSADQQAKTKDQQAARAQVYALHVPAENAEAVRNQADEAAEHAAA